MRRNPFARTVHPPEPAGDLVVATLVGATGLMAFLVAAARLTDRSLSPASWYLARSSGLTLYLLLWLATVTGLGLTTRLLDRFGGRAVVGSVHDFAVQLGWGLLALHILSLMADPTVNFGPRQILVPLAAGWREPWTAFGVLAAQGMVLVGLSTALRRVTGYPFWRKVHWLTPAVYLLALGHGVLAGTDTREPVVQAVYVATLAVVLFLAAYRLVRGGTRAPRGEAPSRPPLDRLTPARPGTPRTP